MLRAGLVRWLHEPPLVGWQAFICGLFAIWVPTIVRAEVNGVLTGCEFTPYLPFVLVCAILLRWWQAGVVALGSVAIMGGLFSGSHNFMLPCFMSAAGLFIGSSAVMIGVPVGLRYLVAVMEKRGVDESLGGIVFSLEKGQVWASWYGQGPPVLLGSQRKVGEMMKDFLAQEELAKRLANKSANKIN